MSSSLRVLLRTTTRSASSKCPLPPPANAPLVAAAAATGNVASGAVDAAAWEPMRAAVSPAAAASTAIGGEMTGAAGGVTPACSAGATSATELESCATVAVNVRRDAAVATATQKARQS